MALGVSYIQRRGSVLWYRRAIPANLQPTIGRSEYLVSLHTSDTATAKRRAVVAGAKAVLQAMSKGESSLSEDDPQLSVVFQRWREERRPPERTWLAWDRVGRHFEEIVGADLPVRSITRGHVRAYRDALVRTPAVGKGGEALSPSSVQTRLTALRAVLSWTVSSGYVDHNVASGVKVAGVRDAKESHLPFGSGGLRVLFDVEALDSRRRHSAAGEWVPWLASTLALDSRSLWSSALRTCARRTGSATWTLLDTAGVA